MRTVSGILWVCVKSIFKDRSRGAREQPAKILLQKNSDTTYFIKNSLNINYVGLLTNRDQKANLLLNYTIPH